MIYVLELTVDLKSASKEGQNLAISGISNSTPHPSKDVLIFFDGLLESHKRNITMVTKLFS